MASRRATTGLAAALLLLAAYAVFSSHGAIEAPAEPRLQVALAFVAAVTAAVTLYTRTLTASLTREARLAAGLLAAFAGWSGLTLAWSVAPDLTWIEFNRTIAYLLVLGLAVVLGASTGRAITLTAAGLLALTGLVTLYALGQKLLPGLHLGGLVNLDQTGAIARLQQPIGYWNALALLLVMGAAVALTVAATQAATKPIRLVGIVALQLMLVAGAFTYSRGGLLALAVALAACVALAPGRLRTLLWAAAGGLAALPPIALGLAVHSLSADGVPLAQRESAGLLLLVVLVACSVVLVLGADRLLDLERTVALDGPTRDRVVRALRRLAVAGIPLLLIAFVASGAASHLWHSFTTTRGVGDNNPSRLFLADSANRWVWWKEALGAFSDRPLAGWGAGAFKVVHLLYRHDTLSVSHVHSAPLEWLAETGLIGAALAIGSWSLLLRTGLVTVRRAVLPAERGYAAALLAAALAYTVHALYDWDWDSPAVTVPALIVLGVLAGAAGRRRAPAPPSEPSFSRLPGPAARLVAVAAIAAGLCLFGVSAALPSLASSRAQTAVVEAASQQPGALAAAQRDALAASRLDPLSDAGLEVSASIAQQRGELRIARDYMVRAIDRVPTDAGAWSSLAFVDAELHRYREALTAADRMFSLDPYNAGYRVTEANIAVQASTGESPPADSATAGPTP